MTNIIVLATLLIPWIIVPIAEISDQTRLPKTIFFDVTCLAIISSAFIGGTRFVYKNKYFGWLFTYVCFSFFVTWMIPYVMTFERKRYIALWNIEGFIHMTLAFFASYCAMSRLDRVDFIRIAKAICLSSFLVACFGVLQAAGFDPMKNVIEYKLFEKNHVAALLDHPNVLGNFLALSLPFFLIFQSWIYAVGAGTVILCLYCSHSTTSIIAMFVSIMSYFFIKNIHKRRVLLIIGTLFIVGSVVFMSTPTFNKISGGFTGRVDVWGHAAGLIKNNPLFGGGANSFAMSNYRTFEGHPEVMKWEFVHNDYIEFLVSFGFIGFTFLLLFLLNTLNNFNYSKENVVGFSYMASLVAFLCVMMGNFPMEYAPTALLGCVSLWGVERL